MRELEVACLGRQRSRPTGVVEEVEVEVEQGTGVLADHEQRQRHVLVSGLARRGGRVVVRDAEVDAELKPHRDVLDDADANVAPQNPREPRAEQLRRDLAASDGVDIDGGAVH